MPPDPSPEPVPSPAAEPSLPEPVSPRRRLLILGGLWLFVLVVLIAFRSVVMPFAGAALIAYLLAPLVDRITRVRIRKRAVPRWLAIILIYVAFFVVTYLFFLLVVPQLYQEVERISRDAAELANGLTPERVREYAAEAEQWLTAHGINVALSSRAAEGAGGAFAFTVDLEALLREGAHDVSELARENFGNIVNLARQVVGGALAAVFSLFFILMVAAFMSIDAAGIRSYVRKLIPPEHTDDVRRLVARIDRSLSGVVRGQITICLVNGVLTFIGLVLLGVKFAFLLATVATLLSLVPIFGSIISSVPIVAFALSQGWKTGLGALGWIVGVHALEAYFLNPKIMGSAARIHPLIVAFALIAGERTFGLLGALFAVPVAAVAVAIFDFLRQKAQGEAPAPEV
ncbi:MAG TPA: AI-2E family transporter [Myxococcales bacterium]|nr:AI-2E family transporter [Myxococcales bacterium]